MKTYLADIIPKIQRFSRKLDDLTLLTKQHWVAIDGSASSKSVYIFRKNGELLVSLNGRVEKAKWEYLGNNSLLIDKNNESFLFKHGFLDANVLALKIDGENEYVFLVNENKFEQELNSIVNIISFLNEEYLAPEIDQSIKLMAEVSDESQLDNLDVEPGYIKVLQHETNYILTYSKAEWSQLKRERFDRFHDVLIDRTNEV